MLPACHRPPACRLVAGPPCAVRRSSALDRGLPALCSALRPAGGSEEEGVRTSPSSCRAWASGRQRQPAAQRALGGSRCRSSSSSGGGSSSSSVGSSAGRGSSSGGGSSSRPEDKAGSGLPKPRQTIDLDTGQGQEPLLQPPQLQAQQPQSQQQQPQSLAQKQQKPQKQKQKQKQKGDKEKEQGEKGQRPEEKAQEEGEAEKSLGKAGAPAQLTRRQLWVAAVKPKMYAVAIIPVLVASGAAYAKCRVPFYGRLVLLLGGAICNIGWLNLSNDVFDSTTGADAQKAESVVNLTGRPGAVLGLANALLVASAAALCQVAILAKDKRVALLLAFAVAMGYMYQGPPFRLSYKGLGEPLCFLAFGPFAVSAFYFAMVARRASGALPMLSVACFAASLAVGLTTTAVLFCSHFHQVAADQAVGKISPLVRLGVDRGIRVLSWVVLALYVLMGGCLWLKILPVQCALVFPASFPAALALLTFGWENYGTPEKVRPLKLYALEWHTAVGLALAAGLAVSPLPTPPWLLASFHELQALYHHA